jgi:hypothetical protein
VHRGKEHSPLASTGDTARSTFSIGEVEFSVARLVLPGTDTEATIVVGEMALAVDRPDRPARRVIAVGTAVQDVDDEPGARTDIRIRVEQDSAPGAAGTPCSKPRKSQQRRRDAFEE